jgi:hypothetical protein
MAQMNAAEQIAPTITEPLTWPQICERYPDEWVCLVDIDRAHPGGFDFGTARVVGHGKTRSAPFIQARPWQDHYKVIGHYFTGRIAAHRLRPQVIFDDETRDAFRYRR